MKKNDKAAIVSRSISLQTTVVKAENAAKAINAFLHEDYSFFIDEAEANVLRDAQKILEKIDNRKIYDLLVENEN